MIPETEDACGYEYTALQTPTSAPLLNVQPCNNEVVCELIEVNLEKLDFEYCITKATKATKTDATKT